MRSRLGLVVALARRYLGTGRSGLLKGTTRSALGSTGLGVTAMVIAMALMTGYTGELQHKLLKIGAVQVIPQFFGEFDEDDLGPGDARPEHLAALEHVTGVTRVLYGQGSLSSADGGVSMDVMIRGVEPGEGDFTGSADQLAIDDEGLAGALLGRELAARLGTRPGDVLELVAVSLDYRGPRFRYKRLRMAGEFVAGYSEFDQSYIVVSNALAESLGNPFVIYEVGVDDLDQVAPVRQKAEEMLGTHYGVSDWLSQNPNLFRALDLQKWGLFLLLGLIVVVSTFNVIATLIVLVREKMRDVGVLSALGLRPRQLEGVFVLCGVFLGGVGTALGLLLGSAAAWVLTTFKLIHFGADVAAIYFIDYVPFRVDWRDLLAITMFTLVVTLLASWWPARRAARVEPAVALRYE